MEAKAKELTTIATKEDDEMKMKKVKESVAEAKTYEEIGKGQETPKILDASIQNSEETEDDNLKRDSAPSSSLDMMTKLEKENTKKEEEEKNVNDCNKKTSYSHVWDCGSTLYDSFELNSFKRQLDSAISASSGRSMSMSHLPDRHLPPQATSSSSSSAGKKHTNKISRSLQRLLKSVFRSKQPQSLSSSSTPSSPVYNVVYEKLRTIPESTEKEMGNSHVRRTISERFSATRVVGISCA